MNRNEQQSNRDASPAPLEKGIPFHSDGETGWTIFDGDLAFPVAVLRQSAIEHNSRTMMSYCEEHGVSLAPHGKTTMAPAIFRRQLDDGCWAITAATVRQAKAMRDAGVHRLLIVNQVVVQAEVEWLAEALGDGFEIMCYVDSLDGIRIIEEVFEAVGSSIPLPVLVELGVPQGRTGSRTVDEGVMVAEAVAQSAHLALAGVAGFEGILGADGDRSAATVVCEFLDQIVELTHAIGRGGLFDPTREVIITAGGSAYFDHVVDRFSRVDLGEQPLRIVIRSGGYISHDDVGLHRVSPLGEHPRITHKDQLRPAIEVWERCSLDQNRHERSWGSENAMPHQMDACRSQKRSADEVRRLSKRSTRFRSCRSTINTHTSTSTPTPLSQWEISSGSGSGTPVRPSTSGGCSSWSTTTTGSPSESTRCSESHPVLSLTRENRRPRR